MLKALPGFLLALALALPAQSQGLADRYRESHRGWEAALERGEGAQTRRAVEVMIQREGALSGTSDYNEMRALVGLYDLAARACVLDGAWEDAVGYLQKALDTATLNYDQASATFGRIRKEHDAKLPGWREAVTGMEARLKTIDDYHGLTEQLLKERDQLKVTLADHKAAIAHSERSLKEMDGILDTLRQTREAFTRSLAEWKTFIEKERQEVVQAGSPTRYAEGRVEQLKADETRPKFERIAFTRRLLKVDPTCAAAKSLLGSLTGSAPAEAESAAKHPAAKATKKAPAKAPAKKGRKRR